MFIRASPMPITREFFGKRFFNEKRVSSHSELKLANLFKRWTDEESIECSTNVCLFPKITKRYLRVAEKMHSEGLVTIVHGQTLNWIIPQTISKSLGIDGLSCHRISTSESEKRALEVKSMIQKQVAINEKTSAFLVYLKILGGRFSNEKTFSNCFWIDHQPDVRPYLMSATIGAFHNTQDEAPFSFVFGGKVLIKSSLGPSCLSKEFSGNRTVLHKETCQEIGNAMIRKNMKGKGYADSQIELVVDRTQSIYEKCNKASIGQLIVVGVPEELLDEYMYSCKRGGSPTGQSVRQIVQNEKSHVYPQVRLILDDKILAKDAPVKVVNIMDTEEVESYCKGHIADDFAIEEAVKVVCKVEMFDISREQIALQEIAAIQEEINEIIFPVLE